ncbi:hypothetical protein DFAR_2480047 [Desulfarculales bacterium]
MLAPMPERLNNIVIVLTRPKFPENIGAAARVVANMGLRLAALEEEGRAVYAPISGLSPDRA